MSPFAFPTYPGGRIVLRKAVESDLPFLLALWQAAMSRHFAAAGVPLSEEDPMRRLRMRFDCTMVVLVDGEAVGMFKVDRDGDHQWHLIQIMLSPEVQGKGLGTLLIRSAMAEAYTQGSSLSLCVLKGNPAMALYRRLGFAVIAEEPNAFTMCLDIPRPATSA